MINAKSCMYISMSHYSRDCKLMERTSEGEDIQLIFGEIAPGGVDWERLMPWWRYERNEGIFFVVVEVSDDGTLVPQNRIAVMPDEFRPRELIEGIDEARMFETGETFADDPVELIYAGRTGTLPFPKKAGTAKETKNQAAPAAGGCSIKLPDDVMKECIAAAKEV